MSDNLLPCPFCNGKNLGTKEYEDGYAVTCNACGARGPTVNRLVNDMHVAIPARWNWRTGWRDELVATMKRGSLETL